MHISLEFIKHYLHQLDSIAQLVSCGGEDRIVVHMPLIAYACRGLEVLHRLKERCEVRRVLLLLSTPEQ